jgi:F-type H+-transporting ATPase subunit epsilon
MTGTLHLTIAAPGQVLVDCRDVTAVQAEDATGSFGMLPGHADLLTILAPSVVRWRTLDGAAGFCAIGSGVLTITGGRYVAVACREGVVGDALVDLEAQVRTARERQRESDRNARVQQVRQHALAVRQLVRYLRPQGKPA